MFPATDHLLLDCDTQHSNTPTVRGSQELTVRTQITHVLNLAQEVNLKEDINTSLGSEGAPHHQTSKDGTCLEISIHSEETLGKLRMVEAL